LEEKTLRKRLRFWAGAAFGAALQYFYDPKAGQARRAQLRLAIMDRLGTMDRLLDGKGGETKNGATVRRIDHLRLWRMEPRRPFSRIV
jgi:hypothetical protein